MIYILCLYLGGCIHQIGGIMIELVYGDEPWNTQLDLPVAMECVLLWPYVMIKMLAGLDGDVNGKS